MNKTPSIAIFWHSESIFSQIHSGLPLLGVSALLGGVMQRLEGPLAVKWQYFRRERKTYSAWNSLGW